MAAFWGGFIKRAPWRNPYFREKRQRKQGSKTWAIFLGMSLCLGYLLWFHTDFTQTIRVDGAATDESRLQIEQAINRNMDTFSCAWLFSCRHAWLLRDARLITWVQEARSRTEVLSIQHADNTLVLSIREQPTAFTVLVGEEAWLLDAQGSPVQVLTSVERVRKAVADPIYKGIQWQDMRSHPLTLEQRQIAWEQSVHVWNESHHIPCQPLQMFLEDGDTVRLQVDYQGKQFALLFSLRRDRREQWEKIQSFLRENLVDVGGIEYLDARYHQRLFYK